MTNILEQVVNIKMVSQDSATHFALCNNKKIRYLISIKNGKFYLSNNISSYSKKLELLMKFIKILPLSIFKFLKLGYFCYCDLNANIQNKFNDVNKSCWNMIVGTYDEKQKLVLQCFDNSENEIFIKIGNVNSDYQMKNEINFLSKNQKYKSFMVPELISNDFIGKNSKFNIQITKGFKGKKVEPILTKEIIDIYKEISVEKKIINGQEYEFSHGDFAPWNIKKDDKYIVFDWEYCDYRIKGYDLMTYVISINLFLKKMNIDDAFNDALSKIRNYLPDFVIDKEKFLVEFSKIRGISCNYDKLKKGLMIVFEGTDGSGKSTVINELYNTFSSNIIDYYHWRPGFIKSNKGTGKIVTNPHGKKPYGRIKSFFKFMLFNLDYILGYWFKVRIQLSKGHLVIFDRYYYDYYLDKLRYRLTISNKILDLFKIFIPKPDITFILIGDAKILYERKKEMKLDEVEEQLIILNNKKYKFNNPITIDVNNSIEVVVSEVKSCILNNLSNEK